MDGSIPAWALRLAGAAVASGCTLLVATSAFHWLVASALIAAIALRPAGAAPSLFVVAVGVRVLASEADPLDLRNFVLVFGLHLITQIAAVAGAASWTARVDRSILAGSAKPFVAIQALVQTAALAGAWMMHAGFSATAVPLVAGVALAVLAWVLLLRLRTDRAQL